MAIEIPPEILISDMFDGAVRNLTQDVMGATAPAVFADALTAKYLVAVEDGMIHAIESGDDPKRPMSLDAPARRIQRTMAERSLSVEKYFETVFANRVKIAEIERGHGLDIVEKAVNDLAALHRDRLEWKIADIYNDAGNFTHTPAINFATMSPDEIIGAIEDAIELVKPGNSLQSEYGVTVVVSPNIMKFLRSAMTDVLDVPLVTNAGAQGAIEQLYGEGVRLFSSRSTYVDNSLGGVGKVRMWNDSTLAVVANSSNLGAPSFAVTAIWDQQSAPQGADTVSADIDPRFASVYLEEVLNPRGTNVYAESFFRAEVVNKNRGAKFTVTLPS